MYIDSVHFKGFKSIDDLKISLKPDFNILIGPNGAGKSNFLQMINDSITVLLGRDVTFKYASLKLQGKDEDFDVAIERKSRRLAENKAQDESEPSYRLTLRIGDTFAYDSDRGQNEFTYQDRKLKIGFNLRLFFRRIQYTISRPLFIKFNIPENWECIELPGAMEIPFDTEQYWETPTILPSFLYSLFVGLEDSLITEEYDLSQLTKEALFERLIFPEAIVDNLSRFSPIKNLKFNENITVYKDESKILVENLKLDFLVNGRWQPWSQLSDGTKRMFYIITEVTDKHLGPILVEEPELGIHPHQFNRIMEFLKEESHAKQIIISTHSPSALNHVSEDELDNLLIASYSPETGTQIKHLSENQRSKALEYMKEVGFLSDYWLLSDLEQ